MAPSANVTTMKSVQVKRISFKDILLPGTDHQVLPINSPARATDTGTMLIVKIYTFSPPDLAGNETNLPPGRPQELHLDRDIVEIGGMQSRRVPVSHLPPIGDGLAGNVSAIMVDS